MQLQNETIKERTPIKGLLIDWLIIFGTYLFYPCILRPLWASSEYCPFGLLPCDIAISFGGSIFTEIPQAMSIMAFCIGYFNTVHC